MHFKVTARTILHLGAELISSDGIAFYELIKNAFDANSKNVKIDIVIRIPSSKCKELQKEIEKAQNLAITDLKDKVISSINMTTPESQALKHQVLEADSHNTLLDL